jgi:hypothetical protein
MVYLDRLYNNVLAHDNVTLRHYIVVFIVILSINSLSLFTYHSTIIIIIKLIWLVMFIYVIREIIRFGEEKHKK